MNRATWLQDRRMQKFRDVLSRWEHKELSTLEAGEIFGCSERQFRRYWATSICSAGTVWLGLYLDQSAAACRRPR